MIALSNDFFMKLIVPWKQLVSQGLMVTVELVGACCGDGSVCTPALSRTIVWLLHASLLGMPGRSACTPAWGPRPNYH